MEYKIVITGANGFLGTHLLERALRKKCEVIAVVRNRATLTFLRNFDSLTIIETDYSSEELLVSQLAKYGPVDLFIHNAGVTKSLDSETFIDINVGLTEKLIAICKSSHVLKPGGSFVYISSMAARGPSNKQGYVSAYGKSKFLAEKILIESGLPYFIFRPTAIYGPRDLQFLPIFKLAKYKIYPAMTSPLQKITMIHAEDVAENIVQITEKHQPNRIIHLTDQLIYSPDVLRSIIGDIIGSKLYNLRIPIKGVQFLLSISDFVTKYLGGKLGITTEQYNEISQDWDHDLSEERNQIPLQINYTLKDGFRNTYDFYKKEKLI